MNRQTKMIVSTLMLVGGAILCCKHKEEIKNLFKKDTNNDAAPLTEGEAVSGLGRMYATDQIIAEEMNAITQPRTF